MNTLWFRLLVIIGLVILSLGLLPISQAQLPITTSTNTTIPQEQQTVHYQAGADDRSAPQPTQVIMPAGGGLQALTFTGIDFVSRASSNTTNSSLSTGCIQRTAGIENYLVDVHLPNDSTIIGLTYQHLNNDGGMSYLFLTAYAGNGTFTDIFDVWSATASGYQEIYEAPTTPYVVDTSNESLNLIWVPAGTTDELCGATLWYLPPAQLTNYAYWFASAAAFNPGDSSTIKNHDGQYGCIYRPSGSLAMILDLDLPSGTSIYGLRMYYYNNAQTGAVSAYIQNVDKVGGGSTIVSLDSSLNTGYSSQYQSLATPFIVDPYNDTLVLGFHPGTTSNLMVCGVRLFLSYPAGPVAARTDQPDVLPPTFDATNPEGGLTNNPMQTLDLVTPDQIDLPLAPTDQYRSIAGAAFHPIDSATPMVYDSYGCVHLGAGGEGYLVKAVNLPNYAQVKLIRLYYYDTAVNDSLLALEKSGHGSSTAQQWAYSTGNTGYGNIASSQAVIENNPSTNALFLYWNSLQFDATQRLCGVRIWYTLKYKTFIPLTMK